MDKGDRVLLTLCILASSYGLLLIYSATRYTENYRYITVQLSSMLIGILIYMFFSLIDFRAIVEQFWAFVFAFNVGFLFLLKTSLGEDYNSGNLNWLSIPGFPIDIQPNEIVKVTFILLTAYFISRIQEKNRSINEIPCLLAVCAHSMFIIGLVAYICGDWGMCVIYGCIILVILWSAGVGIYYFAGLFATVGTAVYVIWTYYLPYSSLWDSDYRILRFRMLFDRSLDPEGYGYQQARSILAIGSGKLFGQGYLQGIQTQSTYSSSLPARHTDFIFSVCGEELGFIGCGILLLILACIVLRCIWVSQKADNYFSAYVAMGIAGMMLAQIIFNVGMCLYVLPTMGLTLPFISYGGSSIITCYASMGVVSSLQTSNLPSWIRDRSQLG